MNDTFRFVAVLFGCGAIVAFAWLSVSEMLGDLTHYLGWTEYGMELAVTSVFMASGAYLLLRNG
jgi:hypothetical protein